MVQGVPGQCLPRLNAVANSHAAERGYDANMLTFFPFTMMLTSPEIAFVRSGPSFGSSSFRFAKHSFVNEATLVEPFCHAVPVGAIRGFDPPE